MIVPGSRNRGSETQVPCVQAYYLSPPPPPPPQCIFRRPVTGARRHRISSQQSSPLLTICIWEGLAGALGADFADAPTAYNSTEPPSRHSIQVPSQSSSWFLGSISPQSPKEKIFNPLFDPLFVWGIFIFKQFHSE